MTGTVDLIGLTEAGPGWEAWAERSLTPPGPPRWCARRDGHVIDAPTADKLEQELEAQDGRLP